MFGWFKNRRRRGLRSQPVPTAWLTYITANVPLYSRLPEADQEELQGHIQVFLAEKYFKDAAAWR